MTEYHDMVLHSTSFLAALSNSFAEFVRDLQVVTKYLPLNLILIVIPKVGSCSSFVRRLNYPNGTWKRLNWEPYVMHILEMAHCDMSVANFVLSSCSLFIHMFEALFSFYIDALSPIRIVWSSKLTISL